jgi:hypothetical protein
MLEEGAENRVETACARTVDRARLLELCGDNVGRGGLADVGEPAGRLATGVPVQVVFDGTECGVIARFPSHAVTAYP